MSQLNNNRRYIAKGIISLFFITILLSIASFQFSSCSNNSEKKNNNDSLSQLTDSLKSLYDYSSNHKTYRLTFLEFGSKNCIPCKMMESVLDSVKAECSSSVNVVFYNVRDKKNKVLVKYYGIDYIPVQVLLDNKGNEFFRHVGYYPYDSIAIELKKHNAIN
ncbi:MAG TPA: thioredoxin family protein [Bacteroidales bacterium]|nr:thioredoxin family protein [Bacteroidales bacterium]HPS17300.1 thioredoxin family protein [Bacteroidales bacterium]